MRELEFREDRHVVIGALHLPPLPGSPRFRSRDDFMSELMDFALRNARRLEEAGFDAVILENFNDNPFRARVRDVRTISAITLIAYDVSRSLSIPVGVNILRNSCPEAAAIAIIANLSFIRCNAYCEALVSAEGVLRPLAREVQMVFSYFNRKVKVLADVLVKHATPLHRFSVEDLVHDCVERCLADAIVVTGSRTGKEPDLKLVRKVVECSRVPVLVGSGMTSENVRMYAMASGFIVGTYVKDVNGEVNVERAKRFVQSVRAL